MGSPVITVVAVDSGDNERARFVLDHGADPEQALRATGLAATELLAIDGVADPWSITIRYRVTDGSQPIGAHSANTSTSVRPAPVSTTQRDPGVTADQASEARRHQRVAAYARVISDRGVLLTELSRRTNAPGQWTLPGGGLDPGESPQDGVIREVFEETGQTVTDLVPLSVTTAHWVGASPVGDIEDFHAVRLMYTAACPAPTDVVLHDIGGSTESAAWVVPGPDGSLPVPLVAWAADQLDLTARPAS